MEKNRRRTYITLAATIFFIAFWTILLMLYNPKEIVKAIGIENGYLLTFFVAMLGAFSSLTFASVYPMIVTFALGDLNPVILTVAAGSGLTIGDALFYYLGMKVRPFIKGKMKRLLDRFLEWTQHRPAWLIPLIVYFYVGFTPFPNNLLTGSLAASGYAFKKAIIPVLLGNISFPVLITILTDLGVDIFS